MEIINIISFIENSIVVIVVLALLIGFVARKLNTLFSKLGKSMASIFM
jgi:hypothetical protein